MEKIRNFPKEDHEKKQLEEIARLYFSKPARPRKVQEDLQKSERPLQAFYRAPQALFVYCTTCEQEQGLSTWFLFNLAVMLKLVNGPVLLIGSVQAYEKRFLFGFRPDRERLRFRVTPPVPSSSFGPMGVCLLDSRLLSGEGFTIGRGGYGSVSTQGGGFVFRYVLSDEVRSGVLFRSMPGLAVLVITPATTTDGLLGSERGTKEEFIRSRGHVGIVVAGAGCAEEANALYRYWQDKVKERCGDEVIVETFGMFSLDSRHPEAGLGGMEVLDNPQSAQARFCQAAASMIRSKRSEMVARVCR